MPQELTPPIFAKLQSRALLFPLLFLAFIATGCATLIPNYEVLPLPSAAAGYTVGAHWIAGVGTSGPALASNDVETFAGVDHLATTDAAKTSIALQAPVIKWISGSLGLSGSKDVTVDLHGLKHLRVKDAYPLQTTKTVLWEVVTADSLSLTLNQSNANELSADVVASKLTAGITGDITLHVASTSRHSYAVTASRPLVIAIRVVRLEYAVNAPPPTPLNLVTPMQGKPQPAGLGYNVSYQGLPDPLTSTVTLSVRNDGLPQFAGVTHSFRGTAPWINPNREAIQQIDPQAAKADYVWDILSVIWDQNLSQCLCKVVRQYIAIQPAASGLADTM